MILRWDEWSLHGVRDGLRGSLLNYVPDHERATALLRRYFSGRIGDAQVQLIEEEARSRYVNDSRKMSDLFESLILWNGAAWHEEFAHASREMTPSDILLVLADLYAAHEDPDKRFPEPKLYCPPQFIGTWEQTDVEVPGPVLWHLFPDGTFETNHRGFEHFRWWGVTRKWNVGEHESGFAAPVDLIFCDRRPPRLAASKELRDSEIVGPNEMIADAGLRFPSTFRRVTPPADAIAGQLIAGRAELRRLFTAYLVDPREAADLQKLVEKAFNEHLHPIRDDVLEPGRFRVGAEIFGADVILEHVGDWADGRVYRLSAGTTYERPPVEVGGLRYLSIALRCVDVARVISEADYERWDRERRGHRFSIPVVRSAEEAMIYMEVHPCAFCDDNALSWKSRLDEVAGELVTTYEGICEVCGASRKFEFSLDDELPPPHTDEAISLGRGPSRALDVAQLTGAVVRILESTPSIESLPDDDKVERDRHRYRLRLANGAIETALLMAEASQREGLLEKRAEILSRLSVLRG